VPACGVLFHGVHGMALVTGRYLRHSGLGNVDRRLDFDNIILSKAKLKDGVRSSPVGVGAAKDPAFSGRIESLANKESRLRGRGYL